MPVTLKNASKKTRTFELPSSCDGKCDMHGTHVMQMLRVQTPGGETLTRPKKRRMPPVLTMRAGEVREGLPDQVLACPSLKRALANPRDGMRLVERKRAGDSRPPTIKPKADAKPKAAPKKPAE